MIVFHVFVSFFLTVLKYLKCIDCWLSFKNKTIWVILQRLALNGNGTKFSSIFFKPLHDFGARTWDALLYSLWYFPSALIALSDWRQSADSSSSLSEEPWECADDFTELCGSLRWKPFCNSCDSGDLCVDQRFGYSLFLVHFIVLYGYTQESWILFPRQILQLRANVTQWILRAWSNFVPGRQCAANADLPPCSRFQGWSISVHITVHDQYALSDSLIFILLSLY